MYFSTYTAFGFPKSVLLLVNCASAKGMDTDSIILALHGNLICPFLASAVYL